MLVLLLPILLGAGSDFVLRPPGAAPSVVTNPDWIRQPNGVDLANFYPPQALQDGVSGHTSMECLVKSDGTLTDCHILSESPAGKGFGSAELRLASRFKMRPQTADGRPVEGAKVVIPIAWSVAAGPVPPIAVPQPQTATPPAPTPH